VHEDDGSSTTVTLKFYDSLMKVGDPDTSVGSSRAMSGLYNAIIAFIENCWKLQRDRQYDE
jgi:hypothetical protein